MKTKSSISRAFLLGTTALAAAANLPTGTLAADVKAPFELETTKVLPKGVRNPRFKNIYMDVQERYNGGGGVEQLGSKLNKRVTWADVLAGQDDDTQRAQIEAVLQDSGIDKNGSGPGMTTGVVNSFANVMVPVLGMGISNRWTLAAALPVYNVDVQADTGFVRSTDGQAFVTALQNRDGVKANEAADKLNNAIPQKLAKLGYDPIVPMRVKGIGDVKLVSKVLAYDDGDNWLTVKNDLTAPTGKEPNPNRALDVPTGDGQTDVGATLIYDRKIGRDFRLNTYAGYTMQLPDKIEKRLPVSETDTLSADKEDVSRNLGDLASVGTSLSYEFERLGWSLGTGYSYQFMARTTYKGTLYPDYRYRLLENEAPLQSVHAAVFQTGFSTVGFYKAKKFPLPFQINASFSKPFMGRNVTKNDVIAGELVMFF